MWRVAPIRFKPIGMQLSVLFKLTLTFALKHHTLRYHLSQLPWATNRYHYRNEVILLFNGHPSNSRSGGRYLSETLWITPSYIVNSQIIKNLYSTPYLSFVSSVWSWSLGYGGRNDCCWAVHWSYDFHWTLQWVREVLEKVTNNVHTHPSRHVSRALNCDAAGTLWASTYIIGLQK